MNSNLYSTTVMHQRYSKFKNKFKYSVLSMFIDCDEINMLSQEIKYFSYNKFNLFSYYDKDHGFRDNRPLREFVENFLSNNNFKFNNLKIKIMCFPRILGYVFNPLSIIYCFEDETLVAIFYEVKNTSNEQHTYFFSSHENKNLTEYHHNCYKNFYVSPFIGMKATYKFKNSIPNEKMSIKIDLFDENKVKIFTASQFGKKISLNSLTLLKELFINPLVTIKVIFAIMYEALFIFFKGGKFYRRKKKLKDTISFEGKL
jgi:DUF1365 family protein|tara:strand:- start:880 stop:1653 length:774 start_codon:yes stop_codon:yes gene_type:complete